MTKHYELERQSREALIKKIGIGKIVKSVVIDRGHRNGPEVHAISETGIIMIFNKRTKELVTKLIARPAQIERYYKEDEAPDWLLTIAKQHQTLGYNKA